MTEEKTGIDISDSVVMGDVQQNILKTECPSCSASNVKVMKCQEVGCTSKQFCELCHTNCRYSPASEVLRFDSGTGSGPFCSRCLTAKLAVEKDKREKRLEKERYSQLNELYFQEREEERKKKEEERKKKKEDEVIEKKLSHYVIPISLIFYILIVFFTSQPEGLWDGQWYTDGVLDDKGFRVFMSAICCAPILVSPIVILIALVVSQTHLATYERD